MKRQCVREKHWLVGCLHMYHDQESNPQPRLVYRLGIEPVTFWCIGQCSNQLSHPTRACSPGFINPYRESALVVLHWCNLGLPWSGPTNLWKRPSVTKPWRIWLLFGKHVSCAQLCAHYRWANAYTCGLCFITSFGIRIWSTLQDRNNDFGEMDLVNHTGPQGAKC